jgi:hypothetical protein
VPGGFVEKWAKPVGARASRGVHAPVSLMDFSTLKSSVQVTQRQRPFRIVILKMEPLGSSTSTAKKVMVKRMKDSSLLIVIVKFDLGIFVDRIARMGIWSEVGLVNPWRSEEGKS